MINTCLLVLSLPSVIPVTQTIHLTTSLDIKHSVYKWASAVPGDVFELGPGVKLTSSTGDGVIDGAGLARGVVTSTGTTNVRIAGLTFQDCRRMFGDWPVAITLLGGDRPSQSGGRNIIDNCVFIESGRVEVGGYGHFVKNSTFWRSPDTAVHEGVYPLAWDKFSENGCSNCTFQNLTFVQCAYKQLPNWDGGVMYAGRSFASRNKVQHVSFYSNNGVCFYRDDAYSWTDLDRLFGLGNFGMLLKIGGGQYNTLQRVIDVDSAQASVWDDRANKQNGTNGTHAGAYRNGAWHDFSHGGPWNHGGLSGISGPGNTSMYGKLTAELRAVMSPEALNWRTALGPRYLKFFSEEATFATSGSIEYRREGVTPPIQNGYGQPLNHPGVTIQSALPM